LGRVVLPAGVGHWQSFASGWRSWFAFPRGWRAGLANNKTIPSRHPQPPAGAETPRLRAVPAEQHNNNK